MPDKSDSITSPQTTEFPASEDRNAWGRFVDSFKPVDESTNTHAHLEGKDLTDLEKGAIKSSNTDMKQELTTRHLLTIAIGGAIGTGLFVNSGSALNTGGPAALVIGWAIIGTMTLVTSIALGELCVTFPVTGGFTTYTTRFIDPSLGFALGWNYFNNWFIMLPLELVATGITINYWRDDINADVWVAVFYVFIIFLNMLDLKYYAESEVVLTGLKLIAAVGFFFLGIILVCGGGPQGGYIGAQYWYNPGAFSHGFKGVCSVFVTAAFSYGGIELVGVTAAETSNPRVTIPKASKRIFWLVTCIYITILTLIGCLVPYDDERLLNGDNYASVSPFVISIQNAGIKGLPSVMNAVILISILSVANSSVYSASRILVSLADIGHAPKFLSYVDRTGRPLYALFAILILGLISFIAASNRQSEVFLWLAALSGLSTIFAWMSILFAHIRFRRALAVQGRNTDELSYVAEFGVWGSYYGLALNILVLIAQFWVGLFPGKDADVENFFEVWLSLCILIVFYLAHKIWTRNWTFLIRAKDMDIDTGRKHTDMELLKQEIAIEKENLAFKPFYVRFFKVWC